MWAYMPRASGSRSSSSVHPVVLLISTSVPGGPPGDPSLTTLGTSKKSFIKSSRGRRPVSGHWCLTVTSQKSSSACMLCSTPPFNASRTPGIGPSSGHPVHPPICTGSPGICSAMNAGPPPQLSSCQFIVRSSRRSPAPLSSYAFLRSSRDGTGRPAITGGKSIALGQNGARGE